MFKDKPFMKKLLGIMIPVAVQNVMLAAVGAGDAAMLGFVDENAMSAVAQAGNIQFLMGQILLAIVSSSTIMASQYWGKQDTFAVGKVYGLILRYAVAISLVFAVAAFAAPDLLMSFYTSDPTIRAMGAEYLRVVSMSYLLSGITQCSLCIMKATGQVRQSVTIGSVALILDTILNAVFIFVFRMGAIGAALTTVISRAVELGAVLLYRRKMAVQPSLKKIPRTLERDLLKYGTPILINSLVWGVGYSLFSVIIGQLGATITAAYAVLDIVRQLSASLCYGLGNGAEIMVANALGSGDMVQAKEYGRRFSRLSVLCGVGCGAIAVIVGFLLSTVMSLSPEVMEALKVMIWIRAFGIAGQGINSVVICSVFAAGGDTAFDAYSVAVTMWLVILPLAAAAAFWWKWDPVWVFAIISLDEAIKIPWVYAHYKKYKWLRNLTRDVLQ